MDLSSLRKVLNGTAPTTTVWIDASRADENGGHEVQLRWQDLADRLRDLGAPDADLQAIAAYLKSVPPIAGRPKKKAP